MNKNILIVLGGGFVIAILVALMVQASLGGGKKSQPVTKSEPRVAIIVAAEDIKTGAKLSETNMKWQEWPESGVFPGAIKREKKDQSVTEALEGRLLRNVTAGEPIVSSAVIKNQSNVMAGRLREGMRAVSLDIKGAALVAGFVQPGDYVDVMLTYRSTVKYSGNDDTIKNMVYGNVSKLATETIMENVRVLALDRSMNKPGEGDDKKKSAKAAKSITLEVSPEGAEVIALARKMGDVSLSLRRLGDETMAEAYTPATTDARITNIWDEIYATMEKMYEDKTGQGGNIVRVYSGASPNSVPVGQ
ncbi:MAG: Flp pilus assembly protein CpaB [Alphaproteobacteria bacterium]|nr:Flp pilus assembly protein CpaB [Alphaproteobacteria bacterium]